MQSHHLETVINWRWPKGNQAQFAQTVGTKDDWGVDRVVDLGQSEAGLIRTIESPTPSNAELLRMAADPAHRPPQAWYDASDDPFSGDE